MGTDHELQPIVLMERGRDVRTESQGGIATGAVREPRRLLGVRPQRIVQEVHPGDVIVHHVALRSRHRVQFCQRDRPPEKAPVDDENTVVEDCPKRQLIPNLQQKRVAPSSGWWSGDSTRRLQPHRGNAMGETDAAVCGRGRCQVGNGCGRCQT